MPAPQPNETTPDHLRGLPTICAGHFADVKMRYSAGGREYRVLLSRMTQADGETHQVTIQRMERGIWVEYLRMYPFVVLYDPDATGRPDAAVRAQEARRAYVSACQDHGRACVRVSESSQAWEDARREEEATYQARKRALAASGEASQALDQVRREAREDRLRPLIHADIRKQEEAQDLATQHNLEEANAARYLDKSGDRLGFGG